MKEPLAFVTTEEIFEELCRRHGPTLLVHARREKLGNGVGMSIYTSHTEGSLGVATMLGMAQASKLYCEHLLERRISGEDDE